MRRLFTALFGFVLLVLGTPALIATIMYDGSGEDAMPVHLYTEDADAEIMLMEELKASFDDLESGVTEDMIFNLHEDIINVAIFQAIREQNPDYMPTDDCATPEACYIVAEQQTFEEYNLSLRVVGAWVDFAQDTFNLNVFLEVELEDGFTYKTVISTEFKFTDVPGKYVLEFEELRIGNLPVPASALSGLLSAIEQNAEDVDFDVLTEDVPVGEVDLVEFSYTIQKDEIVEQIGQDDPNPETDLIKEVLSIIFDQELLTFEFIDEEFVVAGRLSKFQNDGDLDIPEYLYDLHEVDPVTGEIGEYDPTAIDPENYLADLFTEFVFNYALVGDGFVINEEVFNKLIYAGAEGFAEQRTTQEIDLGDGNVEVVELGLEGIWFEIESDAIYAHALMRAASVESQLVITATKVEEESSDLELVFEFTEITFGEDDGESANDYLEIVDMEVFQNMFAEIGDIEFGYFDEFGTLHISAERLSDLLGEGSQEDTVIVTGINIVQDALIIDIEPADPQLAQALEDFSAAINDVIESEQLITDLENLLDTTTEGPEQEVFEAVQDLQETLQNEEVPTAEQVTELFDNFEELDEETQAEFLETFEDLVDPSVLENFEDLFEQQAGGTTEE
jgi:hypothetical protein